MNARISNNNDYEIILKLDRKVYLTSSLVTKEMMKKWYVHNPEFCAVFEEACEMKGVFVTIPLNKKSWERLIDGKLKESEIGCENIFDNFTDEELGIHIYHTEKFDGSIKHFYKYNFEELRKTIDNLRITNKLLKITGISSYSVSQSGIGLRTNLGFKERTFVSNEHILEKGIERIVLETDSKEEIQNKICLGYKYITRCKMLVLYPKEKSEVWTYLNTL